MFITNRERELKKETTDYSTAFLEFQYCDAKENTSVKKITNRRIKNWKDDSIYVHFDDLETFCKEYESVFDCCIHPNGTNGLDVCGINYFNKVNTKHIIDTIAKSHPDNFEILILWLQKAYEEHNGFYILGI